MKNVALLGNPNVGKTTLFNSLTGSNQRVGNWAGVTVDKKEGFFDDFKIVDLPGIYAMDTFSNEEKISKEFLENGQVDLILNIIDASNIDRNLYLTMQLKQFKKPIILAINMIDVAEKKGIDIDYKKLEKLLNVTVVPIQASKEHGIDQIKKALKNININKIDTNDYNFSNEKETYTYIENLLSQCTRKDSKYTNTIKEKLDNIMLNPWLAYPIFFIIMALTFQVTFSWIGQPLSDLLDSLLNDSLVPIIENLIQESAPWFQSLIIDGIIGGVGGILVLLPIILSLFACITILEDSGYMARVAFIMDKIMRKMGLSGKAFIPMIVGFGCSVPAIMTARTLESEKDRKMTALLAPLVTCGARLPVYALFASIFFASNQEFVVMGLYLLGIIVAILVGLLFKNTLFKKDEQPFILELPQYKLPSFKTIILNAWDKSKGFIIRAGTLIFAVSIVVWFLTYFNMNGFTDEIDTSFLARLGGLISPIFKPLGFGGWQAGVSILTGLAAKEVIIGTMEIVYGDLSVVLPTMFTAVTAISFLVFVSLYTPCFAVIGVMKKEYGTKMMFLSVIYQFILAWIAAYFFKFVATLITGGITLAYMGEFLIFLGIVTLSIWLLVKYFNKEEIGETVHLN